MQQQNHAIIFYTHLRHMKYKKIYVAAESISYNIIFYTVSVIFNLEAEIDLFHLNILAKP